MHGARPASADSATEFRTSQVQFFTDNPKKRSVRLNVKFVDHSIHVQADCHHLPSYMRRIGLLASVHEGNGLPQVTALS